MAVKQICPTHGVYTARRGCPSCREDRATAPKRETRATMIRSSARWKAAQAECIRRAGGRCTFGLEDGDRGATHFEDGRCPVVDGLQAHHRVDIEDGGAPFDQRNLRCVCQTHHARLGAPE